MPPRELEATKRAVEMVGRGMKPKDAAIKYGINLSTLYRALKKAAPKRHRR